MRTKKTEWITVVWVAGCLAGQALFASAGMAAAASAAETETAIAVAGTAGGAEPAAPPVARVGPNTTTAANTGSALPSLYLLGLQAAADRGLALVPIASAHLPDAASAPTEDPAAETDAVKTYALIDPTLVPEAARQLPGGLTLRRVAMSDADDEASMAAAPLLVELPEEAALREQVARLTMGWAREHYGASWLLSARSIDTLAAWLSEAMHARLDNGQAVWLRLADARVLPAVYAALDTPQRDALFGTTEQWRYLDRREALLSLQSLSAPADEAWAKPLTFSPTQVADLLAASRADEVLQVVQRVSPAALDRLAMPARHAFAVEHIQRAKALGMEATADIGRYAALALEQGDEFFRRGRWLTAARQVQQGERSWWQVLTSGELRQ